MAEDDPSGGPTDGNPESERFDPTALDRTVIAIPLLKQIEEEKALKEQVKKDFAGQTEAFNAVVLLAPESPAGKAETRAEVQKLIDEALANGQGLSEESRKKTQLGQQVGAINGYFVWLEARTIRRLRKRQRVQQLRGERPAIVLERILPSRFEVIIDLNLEFIGGREKARQWVERAIEEAIKLEEVDDPGQMVHEEKSRNTAQYVFATLEASVIARLAEMDSLEVTDEDLARLGADDGSAGWFKLATLRELSQTPVPPGQKSEGLAALKRYQAKLRAIYRIWPDFEVKTRITRSISTVKANAAINSFSARGKDITWAVMDTGIQGGHPHFTRHKNILDPASPLHCNYTLDEGGPLVDLNGHGTHVAGIIAGEWVAAPAPEGQKPKGLTAVARYQDEHGDSQQEVSEILGISGMAPECRLVSLKVLDENGIGNASNLIAAIAHVQEINGYGRRLLIHGVNISIGYDFDPKWFACGQSPLCVEVDRLVKSGVVVVVAAGNTGYGAVNTGNSSAGLTVTINDPGNSDLAITVGSTHRDMPHIYGVSYFSSKGPTGDGRLKPDLVAPGERIISCASSVLLDGGAKKASELMREVARDTACDYIETSGTSMAAPHVSGVIAAFLSVRREFIGRPEQVKQIFVSTATDLRRDRYFQGAGLIDLMRAIQSV
jgi:serine protease AprX